MGVRIIAGHARGRRLRVPRGGTRPTSGLVRGALLNMLEHRGWLEGASILDLYAGSGAVGIEALSRGARHVAFVEPAPAALRALRANVAAAGVAAQADVLPLRAGPALHRLARAGRTVDGIVADPPYGRGLVQRTVEEVVAAGVLSPSGWMAIEHRHDEPPTPAGDLVERATRRHGNTTLTLLQRAGADEVPA